MYIIGFNCSFLEAFELEESTLLKSLAECKLFKRLSGVDIEVWADAADDGVPIILFFWDAALDV